MNAPFADRITDVPRSFIREILKDALKPGTISFAGGLPNRDLFPVEALRAATNNAFDVYGSDFLQYSQSEGLAELRQFIADRYARKGLNVPLDNILITSGSQQALDLIGKVLVNEGDGLVIEEPGYLGAIQAFAIYRPRFLPVPVTAAGMDVTALRQAVESRRPKLVYTVPNFQNPSGISYPAENRRQVAEVIRGSHTYLIEDNPYGDLRFSGEAAESFYTLLPENTLLLGSFSKTVVPGFRIGWLVAPDAVMHKLVIAKQATDLHTNQFAQCVLYQYLQNNDIDQHIAAINALYSRQKEAMVAGFRQYLPGDVQHTDPDGGMFLWATLPEPLTAMELFNEAVKDRVVFVPGDPFYVNRSNVNTLRLSYSCVDEATIEQGMQRLGKAIGVLLDRRFPG